MAIRLATVADAPAIHAIYAPYVRDTVISFEVTAPTVEVMEARISKTLIEFPWLVDVDERGAIQGYAYASRHRERTAYQWGVDVTVYVQPNAQRGGVGRTLYTTLFALLRVQGFYTAYAGIALPNPASVGFHQSLGFQAVGVYHQTGYKLGQWHDVSWWELMLQPRSASPVPPRPLAEVVASPDVTTLLATGL